MDYLVDNSPAAFVPGRIIQDNILLTHELVKGYGRKGILPRCMLKIDMQKAYDSLEWSLKTMTHMKEFKFHPRCAQLKIVQLGFADDLLLFLQMRGTICQDGLPMLPGVLNAYGVATNMSKSSIYFGGVQPMVQGQILENLCFSKGNLPFRYLGIPLSTKRLAIDQCQPLIDKMVGRITSWTTKFISYAGRMQLVKTILFSIQTFWAQVFVLPKKIVKLIDSICRSFLWTGKEDVSKKALFSWDTIYKPKSAGG
ncbi:uncharacterized protein LOC125817181 [Solanum verrucosum]|uniref:uncharacterized protein LOC125817181 n=1 Tax=Solanum verrucosum TaxID=315347 RepID=UPI0020D11BC8|nr:uncharacterized protein LOC125817181 [Solanum verrucosum]